MKGTTGAPGTIRTSDPQIRSLMLYPAELRARGGGGHIEGGFGARKPLRAGIWVRIPRRVIRALSLLAVVLLSGCASDTVRYPSLSPRPIERLGFDEPIAPAPEAARSEPSLDARLAEVARASQERGRRVEAAFARAEERVGRAAGGSAGSDEWLEAHVALGELDVLRSETSEALTALEQLAADRAVAGGPPYAALDQAITSERAAVAALTARIDTLQRRLPR